MWAGLNAVSRGQFGRITFRVSKQIMCNVNILTGELIRFEVDLFLPGYIPVQLNRQYNSTSDMDGTLGHGWTCSLFLRLQYEGEQLVFVDEDGQKIPLLPGPTLDRLINDEYELTLEPRGQELVLTRPTGVCLMFADRFYGADPVSPVLQMEDANGNAITYSYMPGGLPRALVDSRKRQLLFQFDTAKRLTDVTLVGENCEPQSRMRYGYDRSGDLVAATDALGRTVTYEYDSHLMTRETDHRGHNIFWAYDGQRRCIRTWRDGGILYRNLEFDDARRAVRQTNSLGHVTIYRHDGKYNLISETNPLGQVRENVVDAEGRLVAATGPGGSPDVTTFDETAKCLTAITSAWGRLRYFFDERNLLRRIVDADGREWKTDYDAQGRVVKDVVPGGMVWRCEYAPEGYARKVIGPLGRAIYQERTRDCRKIRLHDDLGELVQSEYDQRGNLTALVDASGRRAVLEYDTGDRCLKITATDGTTRKCEYDANDNITAIIDELGQAHRFEYDACNYPIREVDPLGGVVEWRYNTEQQRVRLTNPKGEGATFAYDPAGRLARLEFPDGQIEEYGYDAEGRVVAATRGQHQVRLEYEADLIVKKVLPDGAEHTFTWEGGFLAGAKTTACSISRTFDERFRLAREQQDDWEITLDYDCMDNLVRVAESDGRTIAYTYDARRRLTTIADTHAGDHRFTYNALNLLTEWRMEGGCSVSFEYDSVDRMAHVVVRAPEGRALLERTLDYDGRDRLVREVVRRAGRDGTRTTEYRYDAADQITEVLRDGQRSEWYQYDANGNIVRSWQHGSCDIRPGDRLLRAGGVSFEYDALGRVVRRIEAGKAKSLHYNSDGTLAKVVLPDGTETRFAYDPTGRRTAKTSNGCLTKYRWLDDAIFAEVEGGHRIDHLCLPGLFFPIAFTVDGERYFVSFDHIGTPREVFAWDGRLALHKEGSVYGQRASPAVSALERVGFMGQYRDSEVGFDYNYFRYYDPSVGRYLSQDPITFLGGINFYRYADADPVNQIDPFGLVVFDISPAKWCIWNRSQRAEFQKKLLAYNMKIEQAYSENGKGLVVRPCPRNNLDPADLWKKDCKKKPPKQKSPKGGKGTKADCTKDIDHMIDCHMGGPQEPPAVCENLTPVNSSVNKSFGGSLGPRITAALGGGKSFVLSGITFTKPACGNSTPRTPECI